MKSFSTFLGVIFGLALLTVFLIGAYYLFEYVTSLFGTLQPQFKTMAIIATIVAIFCAAIVASGVKACSPNSVSDVSQNLYQQLLMYWSKLLKGESGGEGRVADGELVSLELRLALHGSPKVITAHMNLRKSVGQEGRLGDESRELLKKLLLEMRADIGRSELNFSKNDLLDLLLGRAE